MRTVLANGIELPVVGQGTWRMGESAARRPDELRSVARRNGCTPYQAALELGARDLDRLDRSYPRPPTDVPLETL